MELRDVAATAAICTAFGIFGYLFQFCLRFLFEIKSPDGEPISFWGEAALVVVGALALYVLVGALWVVGEPKRKPGGAPVTLQFLTV